MSEETKRSRRRRRPRHASKNRASGSSKAQTTNGKKPSAKSSAKSGQTSASKNSGKENAKSGSRGGSSERRSSSRRGRRRRGSGAARAKARNTQTPLTIQRNTEKSISPINKDIFIYSYTLHPRSLLDSYKAGPNVAEKMKFEQSSRHKLDE